MTSCGANPLVSEAVIESTRRWPYSVVALLSSMTICALRPTHGLISRLVQLRDSLWEPVAEATTLPSTTTLAEVLDGEGVAGRSEVRTSSRMMCPQPPVAVSVTTIVALRPRSSDTSQFCQLISSRLRPEAVRTTCPSMTRSTVVCPAPDAAVFALPPMCRLM